MRRHTLADFDYALPPDLIAQHPAAERSASRLLDATGDRPVDRVFRDLPALLAPGDLLVFNDTRVIRARLLGEKATGGRVEALVERVLPGDEVLAHLRSSKPPRVGSAIRFAGGVFAAEVLGRGGAGDELYRLRFPSAPLALLAEHGHVPLPPYIRHGDTVDDIERYQTVFAARDGAVAAPTAALHFDAALLDVLRARDIEQTLVTLHVGAGTFAPVRGDDLDSHRMHSEWFEVGDVAIEAISRARARGARVVAVGTTVLRALESAAQQAELRPIAAETTLFIRPGFVFRVVDRLITNFHLPRSTLLMLVAAFAGHDRVKALYRHAVEARYRFYSYGDAMLIDRS